MIDYSELEEMMIARISYLISVFLISIILQHLAKLDLIIGIAILGILFFLLVPFATFFYTRRFVSNGKIKWLRSLVCPVTMMMSYLIWYFWEAETYLFALILLVWGELWSLLGLIRRKDNKMDKE